MKISYTVYNQEDEIINSGICEYHDLAEIQWNEFNNGHLVVADVMEDE